VVVLDCESIEPKCGICLKVFHIALILSKDLLGSGLRLLCVPDRRLTIQVLSLPGWSINVFCFPVGCVQSVATGGVKYW
jgi:hypothetical protein